MSARSVALLCCALALLLTGAWISRGVWKPALDRAVAAAWSADDNASARGIEAAAADQTTVAVETLHKRGRDLDAATAPILSEVRNAPDANQPLDPARIERLRRADRVLCADAPALRGCGAAPADDAGDGR